MVSNENDMNLLNFNARFPNEESCREYLKQRREAEGVTCKKCGSSKHYWFANMEIWKCADCGSRTSLRAGTIMEKSHVPVRTWFMCIHLMTSTKKAFSALEMQRQLGMKRYEPVWFMMQKVRRSMGKRDRKYKLSGNIELDDAFFEIVDLEEYNKLSDKEKAILYNDINTFKQSELLKRVSGHGTVFLLNRIVADIGRKAVMKEWNVFYRGGVMMTEEEFEAWWNINWR